MTFLRTLTDVEVPAVEVEHPSAVDCRLIALRISDLPAHRRNQVAPHGTSQPR